MGRFSQYLIDLLPRTGRIILEDGSFINEAESMTGANLAEQQTLGEREYLSIRGLHSL